MNDNLTALHADMRLGRKEARPEDHGRALKLSAFVGEDLPEPPRDVDYLSPMSSIPMLVNDRIGDCVIVAIMHLIQSVTAVMGREVVFTDKQAKRAYAAITGWIEAEPETDQGTNLFDALTHWKRDPSLFGGVELEGWASVGKKDWVLQQQGLRLMGGLLNGYDLPLVTQRQDTWQVEMGAGDEQIRPGGWGGHCTHTARRFYRADGRPFRKDTTWGEAKNVTPRYVGAYGAECVVALIKDWEPPNVKGFDGQRFLQAIREHGK